MGLEGRIEKLEHAATARGDDPRVRCILVVYDGDPEPTQDEIDRAFVIYRAHRPRPTGIPILEFDGGRFKEIASEV